MYENPSAGKFDPPPESSRPGGGRPGRGWFAVVLVLLSSYPITHRLLSIRGRGWLTLLSVALALGLQVFHYIHRFRGRDDAGDDTPYSDQTHLTR